MAEFPHLETALSELDSLGDPRGGAAAWALLVVTATLIASIMLVVF
jgi:hypothetical protein